MKAYLDFVKKMSFVRTAGSAEEKQAAALLQQEITAMGGYAEEMPFAIPDAQLLHCRMEALGREIPCKPYLRTGNLKGTFRFVYLERGEEMDFLGLEDLTDTVVMINSPTEKAYTRLADRHAAAFVAIAGKYFDDPACAPVFYPRPMREFMLRHGTVPGFLIHAKDATDLVLGKADCITIDFEEENCDRQSQNVLAKITGTQYPEQTIILTAHYDSVPVGTGAWDNATGSAALLGIYRHFLAHPPKRTLQFIWCGSEEMGLLGSKAYVAQHEAELEKIAFCFNFDMCGTALGNNKIFITGDKPLETYTDQYCKKVGYSAELKCFTHSSDSAPFCDRDIPALGLSRGTPSAEIHTARDLLQPLSEEAMEKNVAFAIGIIGEVANAAVVPVEKGMSEDMRKDLDKYFHRD